MSSKSLRRIICSKSLAQVSLLRPITNMTLIFVLDIVERFTLSLMLLIVAFRNLIELSGAVFDFSEGFALPKSFGWFRGDNVLWTISYVCQSGKDYDQLLNSDVS